MATKESFLGKIFVRGLLAITPLALTIALVFWIFSALEKAFSVPIKSFMGEYYFPGFGILVALVFIFFIGTIINNFVIQKLYAWGEKLLKKIPFIKTLYGAISDVTGFFNTSKQQKLGSVVKFDFQGLKGIGFVTREDFEGLPDNLVEKEEVAIYIPFSYQIGGFTFFVPKQKVEKLEMSVEEAMRFVLTAGILKNHKTEKKDLLKKEDLYDY